MTTWQILEGDCRDVLATLPAQSVHTCVTSPPYFGLRDYGHESQVGLEPTPDEFVTALVECFREVRRVLRDDGTVWCNLGDSFGPGKQLLGIPWRFAFAMQRDGWILRSDVVWAKPNPMPESVTDRPTKAHEMVFLFAKRPTYYYDADAIREDQQPHREPGAGWLRSTEGIVLGRATEPNGGLAGREPNPLGRNKRSVWTVSAQPYAGAHFAPFPPKLIEPCVLAGCPEGGTVLDPFAGSGTTGLVALRHGRSFVGVELSAEYAALARARICDDSPLFNTASELAA